MKSRFFLQNHSELPLKEDKSTFFLEVSVGVSVFLFSIALAAYFLISLMICSWNKSIVHGLSVQIMPSQEVLTPDEELLYTGKVIQFFEGLENVEKVRLVKDSQIKKLMSPWLGQNVDISALPLPKLLDVRLKSGKKFDYEKTALLLKETAPYASIDNHGIWLQKLVKSASSLKMMSIFVLLIVLLAAAVSIMFAVQTSLKIHRNIIGILHIMGATDDYVAKQYGKRVFVVSLFSSIIGSLFALLSLFVVAKMSSNLDAGLISSAKLALPHWLFLISLPLLTSVFAMATALVSVKRSLGKMM